MYPTEVIDYKFTLADIPTPGKARQGLDTSRLWDFMLVFVRGEEVHVRYFVGTPDLYKTRRRHIGAVVKEFEEFNWEYLGEINTNVDNWPWREKIK